MRSEENPTSNPQSDGADKPDPVKLEDLAELAVSLGASAAKVLPADAVKAEDYLAGLCLETRCPNYNLSPTCPPHVEGPAWLREFLRGIDHVLVLKLELPRDAMYSEERREIGKLLHFIVIQVEEAARAMGLAESRGLAGGSCKNLFCTDERECAVLHGDGQCRHPDAARPSISGYGIDTNHLTRAAGWTSSDNGDSEAADMSRFYGLVLLG
jgi:predicted metal-binding protein